MKICKGKIKINRNDGAEYDFRKRLKIILKAWYNIELCDISEVIERLGVKDKEYEILYVSRDYIHFNFKVITSSDEFEVELFKGTMSCPYPLLRVLRKGKEAEFYSLERIIKVERI